MEYFLEYERAPIIEEIIEKFGLKRSDAHKILLEIEAAHNLALLPGTQRILMAHPLLSHRYTFQGDDKVEEILRELRVGFCGVPHHAI